ncbi:Methyltransferase type 11 [Ruminiclostridium papyrosolvens DSM 2782]|uniref:Methyltransferase type 11 n=1 Tax=Ruminiclostridium papyrosolvens DSM 2782 TaxID=588581 RepID=F1TGQ1_9FIRM|nr:class I SAM-dependent methyltransferase [Ruminiclostridium papyrosolvens]EGD46382.1 Methyltransferase type 11 [Ruminiclostridium papyrosolvens DSM 2782]WES34005.1 class I SAM-dependent methyltransferase [Ruminiclostridium papyrosolvens DSM 2782]
MTEFWEKNFVEKQTMWGFKPSESAIIAKDLFITNNIKDILIPGIGYGRNAKIFIDNNINVTGIEISKTAIDLARQNGINIDIYHGSVEDMPFEDKLYEGIFSYALIHLLNESERGKFISDCYKQLKPGGYMVFTTISKKAPMFGKGRKINESYYETMEGVKIFFYDAESIKKDFQQYGLVEFSEIDEIDSDNENKPPMKFLLIKCKK